MKAMKRPLKDAFVLCLALIYLLMASYGCHKSEDQEDGQNPDSGSTDKSDDSGGSDSDNDADADSGYWDPESWNRPECENDDDCEHGHYCRMGKCLQKCAGSIIFKDPVLEALVMEITGKSSGEIKYEDVRHITELDSDDGISELDGIQCLESLNFLRLTGHGCLSDYVRDLEPLADLEELDRLYLSQNCIEDISPIAGLTGLVELDLIQNEVNDLRYISNMSGLKKLSISRYDIEIEEEELETIAGLTRMQSLIFNVPGISSLEFLSGMKDLTSVVIGSTQNTISEITPLEDLQDLSVIDIKHTETKDLSPLQNLINISELDLRWNEIRDLDPLVDNPGIGINDFIDVTNNPVNCQDQDSNIRTLRRRGVKLLVDCY